MSLFSDVSPRDGYSLAVFSFIGGSCLFFWYYISGNDGLLLPGLIYVIVIGLCNLKVFIRISIKAYKSTKQGQKKKLIRSVIFMLVNVPVTFLYYTMVMYLLSIMRITIENDLVVPVSDVYLYGCEEIRMGLINPNEKVIKWIPIESDCNIQLQYNVDGEVRKEVIVSYVTHGAGMKHIHRLGNGGK